jgi:putative transposase
LRSNPATYFVTTVIAERRALLQSNANASLLSRLTFRYRGEGRYLLHAFVVMPDHLHAMLTPSQDHSPESCMQCIKGGFSYAFRKENHPQRGIWQRGFHEHRIRDAEDYVRHMDYIVRNPERRGIRNHEFMFVCGLQIDDMPEHLRG